MDEFLGSIDLNQTGDLLVSSSYLTYTNWSGYIGYLAKNDVSSRIEAAQPTSDAASKQDKKQPLMLSTLRMNLNIKSGVSGAKWASDQDILVGTDLGEINLYSINKTNNNLENNKFEIAMTKREHDDIVTCIDTKFGQNLAISGSEDSRIKVWDLAEQLSISTYEAHDFGITSVSFHSTDSKIFLSTSQDRRALLWDTRKEKPAYLLSHQLSGTISASGWSKVNPNQFALGSETGELGIYDSRMIVSLQKPFCATKVHNRLVRKVKFDERTNIIATASEDCLTKAFAIVNPSVVNEAGVEEIYSYKHEDFVTDLCWSASQAEDAPQYLTSSWDGMVKNHEISLKKLNGH